MTTKNDFNTQTTTAPIYNPLQKVTDAKKSDESQGQQTQSDWQKWFQQVNNQISTSNYYGNPSLCLNSDFYWNRGIANPVTQGSGDNAFFSEKWQVVGASAATYTLNRVVFPANDGDQTGSTDYVHVTASNWNQNPFYFYQRQNGSQFLRRYQGRNLYLSTKIINNLSTLFALEFQVFFYYDTGETTYANGVMHFQQGINYVSTQIKTEMLGSTTIGAAPYIEFRLAFNDLPSNNADFNLIYIKAEMADIPTALYVDHALEKTRIDNS